MARLRIGLIGWAPPPWGGVSVHVSRLARRLSADGFDVVLIDLSRESDDVAGVTHVRVRRRPWLVEAAAAARRERCDLVHLHTIGVDVRSVCEMAALQETHRIPVFVSIHSLRPDEGRFAQTRARLFAACCNRLPRVIASGAAVADRLASLGVLPHRVQTVLPHIRETAAPPSLPASVAAFAAAHQPLVTAGANALRWWRGQDLYGFDLFVEAAAVVRARYPQAGFIFLLPRVGDVGVAEAALARAEALGVRDAIHVVGEPLADAASLWGRGDVFVRPSRDDGDALSIREALDLGVPVLASDAVPRPAGVRLFRTADGADCGAALCRMLDHLEDERAALAAMPVVPDGAEQLAAMYRVVAEAWR
jgi:glycogen(starch) synthase